MKPRLPVAILVLGLSAPLAFAKPNDSHTNLSQIMVAPSATVHLQSTLRRSSNSNPRLSQTDRVLVRDQAVINMLARDSAGIDPREAAQVAKQLGSLRNELAGWPGISEKGQPKGLGDWSINSKTMRDHLLSSIQDLIARFQHPGNASGHKPHKRGHVFVASKLTVGPLNRTKAGGGTTGTTPTGGTGHGKTTPSDPENTVTASEMETAVDVENERYKQEHEIAEAEKHWKEEQQAHANDEHDRKCHDNPHLRGCSGSGASSLPGTSPGSGDSSDLGKFLLSFWVWTPPSTSHNPTIVDPGPVGTGVKSGKTWVPAGIRPNDAPVRGKNGAKIQPAFVKKLGPGYRQPGCKDCKRGPNGMIDAPKPPPVTPMGEGQ